MHHLDGILATLSWLWLSPSYRNDRFGHVIVLATLLTFSPCHLSQLLIPAGGFGASGLHNAEQLVTSDHHLPHLKGVYVSS